VTNKEANNDKNILHTIERRKDNRNGNIMRMNGFLKHVTEGNLEGTGRRERRREQLPDDLKEMRKN
jgi:hypothetical protein